MAAEQEVSTISTRLVRRIYLPRVVGMALGFVCMAAVLYQQESPPLIWSLAIAIAFIWPHVAYNIAMRSANPIAAEYRNLMVDSFIGGLWIPLMSFNLVPSVILLIMLTLDNIMVGGYRLAGKGFLATVIGLVAGVAIGGFHVVLAPTMLTLYASLPVWILFPLAIGAINYQLSQRLRARHEQLQRASRTDGLSQLNNREYWEDRVESEFNRTRRSGRTMSLIILDIDHFKEINDQYGHLAGDGVIHSIGQLFNDALRRYDLAGRYGGEEFGVLLPETALADAHVFAERLRSSVENMEVAPDGICCTASIGVAQMDGATTDYLQLIEAADQALYQAKHEGRNRVVCAPLGGVID
jgi:diguanylate cyclase